MGDFSAENQNLVNEVYEKISDNNTKEYILSTDKNAFNQSLKTEIKIFITILGEVKYSDLRKFKNRLNSGNSKFSGLIVLKK